MMFISRLILNNTTDMLKVMKSYSWTKEFSLFSELMIIKLIYSLQYKSKLLTMWHNYGLLICLVAGLFGISLFIVLVVQKIWEHGGGEPLAIL